MSIEWSLEQIKEVVEEILTGERITRLEMSKIYVLFKYPTKHEFRLGSLEEKRVEKEAKQDEFPTIEEMNKLMVERGIWKQEYDEEIAELSSKIDGIRKVRDNVNLTKTEKRKKILSESITTHERRIAELQLIREPFISKTLEHKVHRAKSEFLSWSCSYDAFTEKKVWPTFDKYLLDTNDILKAEILTNFIDFVGGHTTEEIRYIARSNLWRINYIVSSKASANLFGRPVSEFTIDQLNLTYWSSFYENILSMLPEDQPDQEVVEDDEALDRWLEDYHKERTQERQEARDSKRFGPSSAMKKDEVIVFKSHPDYEKIEYDAPPKVGDKKTSTSPTQASPKKQGMRLRRLSKARKKQKK
jgi:hypothetical protein